MIINNI